MHLWKPEQFKKHYIYFVFLCSWFFQYGVSNLLLIFSIFIASKKQLQSVLFQIFPKNICDDDGELFLRKVLFTSGTTARLSDHRKPQAHCENLGITWDKALFNEVLQKPEPLHQKRSNKTVSVLTIVFAQIIFLKQKIF